MINYICTCELVSQQQETSEQEQPTTTATTYTPTVLDKYPNIENDIHFPQLCPFLAFPTNQILESLEFHWFVITDVCVLIIIYLHFVYSHSIQ
jgi:hypothetical protein